jgi:DNA-binding NtrC family response regulator
MIQEPVLTPWSHEAPTVLLVDDEFLMREVLTDILEEGGLHTIPVASIDEAKAWLKAGAAIDLVFDGIRMPAAESFALARWIHENRPGMPLILANGYGNHAHDAPELHDTQFLRKPCNFETIVTTIRQTIACAQAIHA